MVVVWKLWGRAPRWNLPYIYKAKFLLEKQKAKKSIEDQKATVTRWKIVYKKGYLIEKQLVEKQKAKKRQKNIWLT